MDTSDLLAGTVAVLALGMLIIYCPLLMALPALGMLLLLGSLIE